MRPEYFIGIVPPAKYMQQLVHFQSKWIKQIGVEPHITLKAQGGLSPDKKWIDKVQKVCDTFKPFEVSLEGPSYFGDSILYLSVNSDEIHRLHRKIIHEISPPEYLIQQYFELDSFVPHLTLAKEQYGGNISTGLSKEELKEMEKFATRELKPYPTFKVTFIRIYELHLEKQKYERYLDLALSN